MEFELIQEPLDINEQQEHSNSFSLEESLFPASPTTHSVDRMRNGMRLCREPMGNGNYREKDGGARLEEVWHTSIEGCAELGDVMNARGLSSI